MQIRQGFLRWGVFLISLGAVPLAIQLGLLSPSIASGIIRLWPVVLIGIGLGLMLRLTPFHLLGGIVVAAMAGLILGSLVGGGIRGVAGACTPDAVTGPVTTRTGQLSGQTASVGLELTCVDLALTRQSGTEWRLDAEQADRPPIVSERPGGLDVRSDDAGVLGGEGQTWRLVLPDAPALTVSMTMNASRASIAAGSVVRLGSTFNGSDARIDLTGSTSAAVFDGTLNASSVTLLLPNAPLSGGMTLNASSLTLCAAPAVGLQVTYSSTLGSENFAAAGLVGSGSTWQTPGYAEAPAKASLNVTSNVSSLNVDRSGGCQ